VVHTFDVYLLPSPQLRDLSCCILCFYMLHPSLYLCHHKCCLVEEGRANPQSNSTAIFLENNSESAYFCPGQNCWDQWAYYSLSMGVVWLRPYCHLHSWSYGLNSQTNSKAILNSLGDIGARMVGQRSLPVFPVKRG